MKITQEILDDLTAKAKESPKLRMNLDLRDSAEDTSQRMLNAIEPESHYLFTGIRRPLKRWYACEADWWKNSLRSKAEKPSAMMNESEFAPIA